jgi:sugar diacid utilization regulator
VASLAQLVASPPLRSLLSYATRPRSDPQVERVALVDDLADLPRVGERAIVLLARAASAEAGSYRFDVALRAARDRSSAALVLAADDVGRLTPTAPAIAARSGAAILGTGAADLAELAIAIARELAGGAELALLRAHAAVRAIAAHPLDAGAETLVAHAGAALGVPLELVAAEPAGGPRAAVGLDGRIEAWIGAPEQQGDLGLAVDIVLHAAAAGAGQALAAVRQAEELPIQSREEALGELLAAPSHGRGPIVQRARDLGVPIDGWHVAARLEPEDLAGGPSPDGGERRIRLSRAVLAAVREDGGTWHSARAGAVLVVVRMYREDPGIGAAAEVAASLDRALAALRPRPAALMRCGVGGAHPGPAGLLASASEAQAALTAGRAAGRVNAAVPFDALGLRRTLVEWYASDVAQEAVASVLAPLSSLGAAKAERLIQTLHVYLDQRGSLTRTAELLNLHRNAVGYRVKQIFTLLDVDPDNPDDVLLLQLACRARSLSLRSTAAS